MTRDFSDLSSLTPDDWAQVRALFGERLNTFGQRLYDLPRVSAEAERTLPCNNATSDQLSDGAATAER